MYSSLHVHPSNTDTHMHTMILDVTVKAQLFHNSTKVCLLKRKAIISLKKSTAPAPLASFQFEADITNMALQVGDLCSYARAVSFEFIVSELAIASYNYL